MILDEEVLKLAKQHLEIVVDDYDEIEYFSSTKEQLIAFAHKIYQMGYDDGCYETSHYTGYTGLFGEPQ